MDDVYGSFSSYIKLNYHFLAWIGSSDFVILSVESKVVVMWNCVMSSSDGALFYLIFRQTLFCLVHGRGFCDGWRPGRAIPLVLLCL